MGHSSFGTDIDELNGAFGKLLTGSRSNVVFSCRLIFGLSDVFASEMATVENSVEVRRAEFAAGRTCARNALGLLNGPQVPIAIGPFREPIWPSGFCGSITHDGGAAAAIAYRISDVFYSTDIACLDHHASYHDIRSVLLRPEEDALFPSAIDVLRAFSAKEAAIKLFSPFLKTFVDFGEMCISLSNTNYIVHHLASGITASVEIAGTPRFVVSVGASNFQKREVNVSV